MCLGVTGLKGAFSRGVVSEARHVLGPLWLTVLMLPLQTSGTVVCVCVCVCVVRVYVRARVAMFFTVLSKTSRQPQNVWFG